MTCINCCVRTRMCVVGLGNWNIGGTSIEFFGEIQRRLLR